MKNTKNLLCTGLVLTIALFTIIQTSALTRRINPYLSPEQKKKIENMIEFATETRKMCGPQKKLAPQDRELCLNLPRIISQLEAIYYGNKAYTNAEIDRAEE